MSIFDEAIGYLRKDTTYANAFAPIELEIPFDLQPSDFLGFAKRDLDTNLEHSVINALSNTKRALECQCDLLLLVFGFSNQLRKKKWNLPNKIDLILELGVVAPRILRRVNKTRNLLEHEYTRPDKSKVEDALDFVDMFVVYTNSFIKSAKCYASFAPSGTSDIHLTVEYDYKTGRFLMNGDIFPDKNRKYKLNNSVPDYKEFLKSYAKKFLTG